MIANASRMNVVGSTLCAALLLAAFAAAEPALASQDHDHHDHAPAESGGQGSEPFCHEHRLLEAECGICHPELAADRTPGQGLKIRLASEQSAEKAGVRTARPETGRIADAIESYAEIVFDQNRLSHVAVPVEGILRAVHVDLGDQVDEGESLATVWSAAVGEVQGEYLKAAAEASLRKQALERERRLREGGATSEKHFQQAVAAHRGAEASFRWARQQLALLGFQDPAIDALARDPASRADVLVRAPFSGQVIERNAVLGELAASGKPLFTIADTSRMWAMLKLPESSLAAARLQQTVELRLESLPERVFRGKLTWVAPQVDPRTRMATARAELENQEGLLKAHMFARARILTNDPVPGVLIPEAAIQSVEGKPWVFVRLESDLYEARRVQLGARDGERQEVVAGLSSDDEVVVAHSFVLKSELLKSRLGAGCVDE